MVLPLMRRHIVAFVEDNHEDCEFNTVIRKLFNVFCVKPKEVDPIKLSFSMKNWLRVSIPLNNIIYNAVLNILH